MKDPQIRIVIPGEVNRRIMAYQGLMEDLRQPIPTKKEILEQLIEKFGPEWLDQKLQIANQAVEAVAKV